MWTAETFYSEFCKQILKCELGDHNSVHRTNIDYLRKRYKNLKGKVASNLCYLTKDEIIDGMKNAAEDWAEDMAIWLNSPIKTKEDWQRYIEWDFEQEIGQVVGTPEWLNHQYIETTGTILMVVLSKIQTRDGGFSFKITTAYCDLSYKQMQVEKKKRGL